MIKIKSAKQLQAAYPELTQKIMDDAVLQEVKRAVRNERRLILGLTSLYFGRDAAEKFGRIAKIFDPPDD